MIANDEEKKKKNLKPELLINPLIYLTCFIDCKWKFREHSVLGEKETKTQMKELYIRQTKQSES